MHTIKVNILPNKSGKKPTKEEFGYLQNNIWKEENVQELDFKMFATMVGRLGFHWKSALLEGGAKNENFSEAYVLSLDFDDDITIEDFSEKAMDLGLPPTFMYKTFSHNTIDKNLRGKLLTPRKFSLVNGNSVYKVKHHRWRAIWRLNVPIDNPQLKTALQLMLMEIFPQCDPSCKDLSRFWVGGNDLFYYEDRNFLDLDNLLNALVTTLSVKNPSKASRYVKEFCKRIGINIYNKYPFMIKEDEKEGLSCPLPNNSINRTMDRKDPKIETINEIHTLEYDGMIFSFDTESYNIKNNSCKKVKQQSVKGGKVKRVTIKFDTLEERCKLYNDFVTGVKLEHSEIYHLSCNLYDCKGYPSILENTLKEHKYNNWENKYNTYATCVEHTYAPSRCESKCKYFNDCMNPKNIKEKYYEKEGSIVQLYEEKLLTLEQAEKQLSEVPNLIRDMTTNDVLFVRAVTGLGKTEMLKQIITDRVIIGVTNHRLGEETYDRLKKYNPNLLYVKPLDTSKMPKTLKNTIDKYYEIGLAKEVKFLVFEEIAKLEEDFEKNVIKEFPEYYSHMKAYVEDLENIPKAETLLITHNRISYGTNNTNIDTIILDEDFLNAFVEYKSFTYGDIRVELDYFRDWLDKIIDPNLRVDAEIFKKAIDSFLGLIMENRTNGNWFKNPMKVAIEMQETRKLLTRYIKESQDRLNMDLFKVFRAEYTSLKKDHIHCVNGDNIKQLQEYKVVIMSATLDDEIHTQIIKKFLYNKNLIYKNVASTELKGEIICDCSYSFSRESLGKLTGKSSKKLEKILTSKDYTNIITFKDNELIDVEPYNKKKVAWYGACEGIDAYKGQDLCVIGTPHTNSAYYESLGVLLTGKSPISNTWKVKEVEKYGYRFNLNTYESDEDEIFTRIQLYCLYSEMIQAIGRARALRFDCKVYVHSALPMPNATVLGVKKAKDFKVIDLNEDEYKVVTVEEQTQELLKDLGF